MIAFAQKLDTKDLLIEFIDIGSGNVIRVPVQGIAWVDPNTYQIVQLRVNLLAAGNQSSLTEQTTDIKFSTLGLGWVHHWDDNVKFVFYYELVKNEKLSNLSGTASTLSPYADDVKDNVFTFRVQYKF